MDGGAPFCRVDYLALVECASVPLKNRQAQRVMELRRFLRILFCRFSVIHYSYNNLIFFDFIVRIGLYPDSGTTEK